MIGLGPPVQAIFHAPSTYETSWTGTEHEDGGAHLGCDLVKAVSGAGSWLQEGCINIREILDLEDLSG